MQKDIVWTTLEHHHTEKSSDWYWALGIVAFAIAAVSVLFGNFLFALLIVIGSATLGMLANKTPEEIEVALTPKGVLVGAEFYPYALLKAFWVEEYAKDATPHPPILLLDSRRALMPHLIIPLENTNPDYIRNYLSQYLPETELREPWGQELFELFGY